MKSCSVCRTMRPSGVGAYRAWIVVWHRKQHILPLAPLHSKQNLIACSSAIRRPYLKQRTAVACSCSPTWTVIPAWRHSKILRQRRNKCDRPPLILWTMSLRMHDSRTQFVPPKFEDRVVNNPKLPTVVSLQLVARTHFVEV